MCAFFARKKSIPEERESVHKNWVTSWFFLVGKKKIQIWIRSWICSQWELNFFPTQNEFSSQWSLNFFFPTKKKITAITEGKEMGKSAKLVTSILFFSWSNRGTQKVCGDAGIEKVWHPKVRKQLQIRDRDFFCHPLREWVTDFFCTHALTLVKTSFYKQIKSKRWIYIILCMYIFFFEKIAPILYTTETGIYFQVLYEAMGYLDAQAKAAQLSHNGRTGHLPVKKNQQQQRTREKKKLGAKENRRK